MIKQYAELLSVLLANSNHFSNARLSVNKAKSPAYPNAPAHVSPTKQTIPACFSFCNIYVYINGK